MHFIEALGFLGRFWRSFLIRSSSAILCDVGVLGAWMSRGLPVRASQVIKTRTPILRLLEARGRESRLRIPGENPESQLTQAIEHQLA